MPVAAVHDAELFYVTVGKGRPCLVLHGGLGLDHTYRHPRLGPPGAARRAPGPALRRVISRAPGFARVARIPLFSRAHTVEPAAVSRYSRLGLTVHWLMAVLVLNALFSGNSSSLARWLSISPRNAVTVLDTHDGIGVIDVGADADGTPGLLSPTEIDNLVEIIHQRSRGQSRQATGAAARNLDLYQVNCTFLDALGGRESEYLIARALQFFAPGIPQVYYVGLLGGTNDMELLGRTGVGRDINRHYYRVAEIEDALMRPLVQKQLDLIRLRNTHPAFEGEFQVTAPAEDQIQMKWELEEHWIKLQADLSVPRASITGSSLTGEIQPITIPNAVNQGA